MALLLNNAGLLKEDIVLPSVPPEVAAAVRDPDHDARIPGPSGPIVFLKSSDDPHMGEALSVLELLCAPHQDLRGAALSYFEGSPKEEGSYLTPFSHGLLREYKEDIQSADGSRWLNAAMRLEHELDADFKFNLAAFRQGLLTNVHELQQFHWPRILRPSVASLLSVDDDGYALVKSRSGFDSAAERLVDDADTFETLLTQYERRFGHLPLCPEMSIGAVAQRWMAKRGHEIRWAAVREWAQQPLFSTRRLLACQIALLNPSLLSDEEHDQFWNDFTSLLTSQDEDDVSLSAITQNRPRIIT